MATSGSFNTSSVSNFYWTFEWYRKSYSSEKSTSLIHYKVTAHNTGGSYRSVWEKNVKIAGESVFEQPGESSSKVSYYDGDIVCEGDYTLQHDSAGKCTFSASAKGGVGEYPGTNMSGSESWTVDTIPRYASITKFNITGKTLNSISAEWDTDVYCDSIDYSLNNGSWINFSSSGRFTISGLYPNTEYSLKIRLRRADSGLYTISSSKSTTTYDIARFTSYSNFNLGDSTTVKYTNPSGAKIQVGIFMADRLTPYAEYRTVTGSNYTFNFTDVELDSMYKAMGKSNSLSAYLYINTADNTYRESKEIIINLTGNQKTGHINVNNSWKRAKKWVNVNGTWKRCIRWVNVNGTWKRCI